jgi:hypothetical protein
MDYVNLDLELSEYRRDSSNHEAFCVHVVRSDFGAMTSDKAVPVTLASEQRKRISHLKRRGLTKEEMIDRGEELGKMLLPPNSQVSRIYDKCLNGLKEGQRLRIRLTLGNYALSDLPWEYAYVLPPDTPDDQKDLRGFLVLNKQISLVRYPATEQKKVSLDSVEKQELRMVVIMANPKDDPVYRDLKIGREFERIREVLGEVPWVDPEPHPDATREKLQDALMKPAHIFHFAGHGDFEGDLGTSFKSTSGQGYIILLGDEGRGDKFPAGKLASLLHASQVRLAVLTACETGETDQINAWTGVAPALIQAGIPAVVGMQFTIEDKNAIAFSRTFYKALAEGLPIDAAVAEGRQAIHIQGKEDERDWGVPVLYLQTDKGVLFPKPEESPVKRPDEGKPEKTGFERIIDLIGKNKAVANAVCLSKEKIKDTSQQIGEMELFKTIHDALHDIESDCLNPMEEGMTAEGLPVFKCSFDDASQNIQEAIKGREITPLLEDLLDRLELAATDFEAAVNHPGDAVFRKVVSDLNLLLSRLPPRLDMIISDAAKKLNLNSLIELLNQVRGMLSAGPELESFFQSIEVLPKMRDELGELVAKHYPLQSLDYSLRTVCVAETIPGGLATEWNLIKLARKRLAPMGAVDKYLAEKEGAIDTAMLMNDESEAMDHLKGYFRLVSKEFRKVDKHLKNVCTRLSRINPMLQTVLDLSGGR